LLARTSHAAIAADQGDLDWLGTGSRGHLIPIGSNVLNRPPADYDRAAFRAHLGLGPNDLAVAYFGFLNTSKGVDTLLAAFQLVAQQLSSARLLLLGGQDLASNATDPALAARFRDSLGLLAERIIQPGYLADESQLSAYLLAADVALLPFTDGASLRRGSLLACAEHVLPIVTTLGPSLAEPVTAAVLARPAGDAPALAQAVLALAHDPALAAHQRRASQGLASTVAWSAIAQRHLAVYTAIMEQAPNQN
jgi:glycosyltransferase involved in cell wall biosynthesis